MFVGAGHTCGPPRPVTAIAIPFSLILAIFLSEKSTYKTKPSEYPKTPHGNDEWV
jgi:hypothetical protein